MSTSSAASFEDFFEDIQTNHNWNEILQPLLTALSWKGSERSIHEAVPAGAYAVDLEALRSIMVHLGYSSLLRRGNPRALDARWLPAIWLDAQGTPHLMTSAQDQAAAPNATMDLVLFQAVPAAEAIDPNPSLRAASKRFHPVLRHILFCSLLVGALALAPTYYNMAIYDHVIASSSASGLLMLVAGAILALCAEIGLRQWRSKQLAYFGARVDHFVSCSVFQQLLFMPTSFTERASVSSQLARLRDFESVREFFTGPIATLLFEMPLIAIYLVAMAVIGGWLALVPLALLVAYTVLLVTTNGVLKERSRAATNAISQRHDFLLEFSSKLRAIRLNGLEQVWLERWRQVSANASVASFRASLSAQAVEVVSYVLMTLGGIATIGFGITAVIDQALTTGALIASMMLVWRILAPMQMLCSSITRIQQLRSTVHQVQRVLAMPVEHNPNLPSVNFTTQGRVSFHRVTLRYNQTSDPALLGVSFEAKPGEMIAIRGSNGSGKSSILKLALGLYQPQGGSVRIDGVDIRQLDPVALRQSIAYVPQTAQLFPGSVRDNLLLANPSASEPTCLEALRAACALEDVLALPQGLDTPVMSDESQSIPFLLQQRLNLARAYLRTAPIMLFDEASHSLGADNDAAFTNILAQLRSKCTLILVTHREDHMLLADRLLVLDKGEMTHAGPPDQVLTALRGKR
ncbi:MAG: ATP-binding cassette domain-containing protein [Pseudomonadota bacterium]